MDIICHSILFDSDGVLVDSHLDGWRAWSQLSDEYDFPLDDDVFATLAGIRTSDSLGRFVEPERVSEAVSRLEDLEVELAANTPPLPGAIELLSSIPADRWAIATSASRRLGLARWAGAGIPLPPVVIAAEDVAEGKPHPEPYFNAAAALGFDVADCLVVEDSPGGGQAGFAAGAQVLAVGDQRWTVEPQWRVADLSSVSCTVTEEGLLKITSPTG